MQRTLRVHILRNGSLALRFGDGGGDAESSICGLGSGSSRCSAAYLWSSGAPLRCISFFQRRRARLPSVCWRLSRVSSSPKQIPSAATMYTDAITRFGGAYGYELRMP